MSWDIVWIKIEKYPPLPANVNLFKINRLRYNIDTDIIYIRHNKSAYNTDIIYMRYNKNIKIGLKN